MAYLPSIFVTVDIVLFRLQGGKQEILLIQRLKEPFKDCWALPGGFVDKGEDLEDAAKRELLEETSIKAHSLKQFKAYGKPGRDPRGHTISIVFYGNADETAIAKAQDDAKAAHWFSWDDLPPLAFDHQEILEEARKRINQLQS